MLVECFNVTKRRNSTFVPSGGTSFQMVLKSQTSILNPVLEVYTETFPWNEIAFTIGNINRYYFVDDVISVNNGIWQIHCSADVLATWKSYIVGASAYVLYSTVGYSDGVPDMRMPVIYNATNTRNSFTIFSGIRTTTGRFILSAVGEGSTGVANYMLTQSQFHSLMNRIANYQDIYDFSWPDSPGDTLEDIFNWLVECIQTIGEFFNTSLKQISSFGNAISNIRACIWIPFTPTSAGSGEIVLGGYHTGITAPFVLGTPEYEENSASIPWIYGDWRDGSRHTDMSIYLPWCGTVSLPVSQMQGDSTITVGSLLSPLTGDILHILTSGTKWLGTYGGNTGVSVPVGVSNINPMAGFNSIINGAIGMATGNPIGGAANIVSGYSASITPIGTAIGGAGNSANALTPNIGYIQAVGHSTPESPSASAEIHGRPTFKTMAIPASGFVQTQDFQVAAPCLKAEATAINALCNGGIYIV